MVSKMDEKRLREAAKELFNLLKPENTPVPDDLDACELWVAKAARIKNDEGDWDISKAEIKSLSFHTQEIVKSLRGVLGVGIINNAKKEKDMSKKTEVKEEKPAVKAEKKVEKKAVKPAKEVKKETKKVEKKPAVKAEKKAAAPKPKKEKCVVEKSKHGHKMNTAMGIIDTLMMDGGTNKEAVHKAMTKAFPEKAYTPEQTHHYLRTFCANLGKRDLSYKCKAGVYSFKK
jgi:hypothetical protein